MAKKISHPSISLLRTGIVTGLLAVGVLTANETANALSPEPSLVAPSRATPPIVPEGQDGELDHTFGTNDNDGIDGFLRLSEESSWAYNIVGALVEQQTDGKFLTVATTSEDGGIASLNDFHSNAGHHGVDGDITIAAPPLWESLLQRRNYDGSLDTTFGQGGSVSIDDSTGTRTLVAGITLQTDGKIVVVGVTDYSEYAVGALQSNTDHKASDSIDVSISTPDGFPFVMRLHQDGSADTTFGTNGIFEIDPQQFNFGIATDVTTQADGKIVVAGYLNDRVAPTSDVTAQIGLASEFFAARFTIDGSLDTSFAGTGIHTSEVELTNHWIKQVFTQSDGKIVIAGSGYDDNGYVFAFLTRLTSAGVVDTTYGTDGVVSIPNLLSSPNLFEAAIQPDNQIVIANTIYSNDIYTTVLSRITVKGEFDQTFGTNGELILGDGVANRYVLGLSIQPDGKILATGNNNTIIGTSPGELSIYRFRGDGTPDWTFGDGGLVSFDLEADLVGLETIVQPNGQLLIFGTKVSDDAAEVYDFVLRLNSAKPISVTGLSPSRLFDTRTGSPQGTIVIEQIKYGKSKELRVKVAGVSGLPEYGIGAVTFNLTVTDPDDTGYITVYPCGTRPLASNINFVKNQTVSTSVTTAVSPAGEICIYSSANTNLIADINSWSAPNAGYAPVSPQRLFDTRALSPQGAISVIKKKYGSDFELRVKVAGAAGLPGARIGSVSLNITVTEPEGEGFITVYPCGTRPLASSLNFVANQTISTSVTSPVSVDGEICIYSSAMTNLIADAFGWFVQGSGVTPVGPTRLVDTRSASPQGAISVTQKKYGATDELRLPLNGVAGLPNNDIGTVQLTVTAANPNASGFITVYPCGTLPLASNLNYTTGQTVAVSVTAQVSGDGTVCIYSSAATDVIVDINGWGNQPRVACDGSILEVTESDRLQIACR